jgi:farnesyl-diphosphate farnesyltransferase
VEAQEHVRKVIEIIITGQGWDLTRFAESGVVRLQQDEELEGYTYQVAGCVGEFWTRIGFLDSPKFARAGAAEMEAMGRAYGQGLQLINILRDVPEDLERGRCYLPGASGLTPEALMPEMSRWQDRADVLLDQGLEYCDQLRGCRAGVASGLPVLLGKLTLARLRRASWGDLVARVKVTRAEVKKAGWLAFRASMGAKPGRWKKACERLLEGN